VNDDDNTLVATTGDWESIAVNSSRNMTMQEISLPLQNPPKKINGSSSNGQLNENHVRENLPFN
jgi:hypothetical protein